MSDVEKHTGSGARGAVDLTDQHLAFPVGFELRIIYFLEHEADVLSSLVRVLGQVGASPGVPRIIAPAPAAGAARDAGPSSLTITSAAKKYGRMGCQVTFADREAMYEAYRAVGAIPGVKTVL